MGAMRIEISPIHFLRQPGYEGAEETIKLSLPVSANLVGTHDNIVGASIARPLLRLSRQFVTVTPHLTPLPMFVALLASP